MRIPKIVKVGAARYSIRYEERAFSETCDPEEKPNSKDFVGEHLLCLRIIRIALRSFGKKMSEESIADTFLHELLHAISRIYGIGLTENQVSGLSGGLMQVIRDNGLDFCR